MVSIAGPAMMIGLMNSGGEPELIMAAVSTPLGGAVGVGVGVAVAVGVGVGVGVPVGVGVAVGVEVEVGVAADAMTTPRVVPPSCVKL